MIGFICGVPISLNLRDSIISTALEVKFLCV
jgi:hypothetical protein